MNKLKQFKDESLYIIDVAGGKIGLDAQDINIDINVQRLYNTFTEAQKHYRTQKLIIDKQEEGKPNELGITPKTQKQLNLNRETIKKTCEGIDALFGKNASDKIFYHEIFDEPFITVERIEYFLTEALPEQLDKFGVKTQEYLDKKTSPEARKKYLDKDEDILEVK